MRLVTMYLSCAAVIGMVSFICPPALEDMISEKPQLIISFFRIALAILIITGIPAILRHIRDGKIKEFVSIFALPIGIGLVLGILYPDIPSETIEHIVTILLILNLLLIIVLKHYFVKRWGVEINSYHAEDS